MQSRLLPLLVILGLTLGGCSNFLRVYKIDINQGNVVTKDMVDKLKPGMTPAQVRYVLGTPLVTDTLDINRWDYVYDYKPGTYAKLAKLPAVHNRRLTVWFENGVLAKTEGGDTIPASNPSLPATKDKAITAPPL